MRAQNKMIFWALLAVAAFAAQHPLMKPLASLHTASLWTTFGVALLIEILAVTIFAVTLVDPVARLEFSQLLKQPAQRQAAFALAVISSISGLAYVYAVARLDPIYVALILNLYPMYALLVNAAMVRKLPPAFAIVTTAIGAAGVILSRWLAFPTATPADLATTFVLTSLVPVSFAYRTFLFYRIFAADTPKVTFYRLVSLAAFDAPVMLIVWVTIATAVGAKLILPWGGSAALSCFIAGTLLAIVAGPVALQMAFKHSNSSPVSPTIFFFLIPETVAIYDVMISHIIGHPLKSTDQYFLPGIIAVGLAIIVQSHFEKKEE